MSALDKSKSGPMDEPTPDRSGKRTASQTTAHLSPVWLLLIVILSIFVVEAAVMVLLSFLKPHSLLATALLDSALLVAVLFPAAYCFVFRPFLLQISERKEAERELLHKTALLEAQTETSIDGIMIVDDEGNTLLSNKRFAEMWNIPQKLLDTRDDEKMLRYVLDQLKDPDGFIRKVRYLYSHRNEKSRDEIEFKDGKVFDRFSSPLIDTSGKHHGRIWFFRDITERTKAEDNLRRRTHDLGERVKELRCLYEASKLIAGPHKSQEEVFQGIADLTPPSWQYPDATCGRITVEGRRFQTKNFEETVWRQSADVVVSGETVASVEVCYLEEKPAEHEGPFLKEERDLIDNLARELGRFIEREREGKRQELMARIMELLNREGGKTDKIRAILLLVREFTGLEAAGIRLREGEDFPYYETAGFPADFVEAERSLCARGPEGKLLRDPGGVSYIECMCGNVIRGRTDPSLPFFTVGGSFWTNSTTGLLASTTEEDRLGRTRNRCNRAGYESVALVPLRSGGEIIGLLQLNDGRKGMFTPEMICFFEVIGASVGIAIARKRAEEELGRSREELRNLASHVQSVREEERTEMAREIHDNLAQSLTALRMDLAWVRKRVSGEVTGRSPWAHVITGSTVAGKIASMLKLVDEAGETAQRISMELRPGILDDLGLAAAIRWQLSEFERRSGIRYELTPVSGEIALDTDRATAVFRIFQEALTNVIRHAHATEVRVGLELAGDEVTLHVADNGKGIAGESVSSASSFGLIGMRERARGFGGRFEISGAPGEGTTVRVVIPAGDGRFRVSDRARGGNSRSRNPNAGPEIAGSPNPGETRKETRGGRE